MWHIQGVDVIRAIARLESKGEISEKITKENYKSYVDLITSEIIKNVPEPSLDFISESTTRVEGLLRYLVVRDRI